VLIVDDHPTNLEIVTALTQSWGMQATAFLNPLHALRDFGDGQHFDVVLLDYNMPGMDGAALAQALRGLRPDLAIVLLSSSDGAEAVGHLFDAQLHKPVRRALLLDALQTVLSHAPLSIDARTTPAAAAAVAIAAAADVHSSPDINALVVRAMLKRMGFLSEHAGTGVEAVQAVQRQNYDLVFMDMQMPEMDGPEATRLIRQLPLTKQPYIVAFTANVMAEDRLVCREAGMDAFIGKPVRVADMQACLAEYDRHCAANAASQEVITG
jgi:CheY-like chemotaxis protein